MYLLWAGNLGLLNNQDGYLFHLDKERYDPPCPTDYCKNGLKLVYHLTWTCNNLIFFPYFITLLPMTFDIIMHGVAINFHTNVASCHVPVVVVVVKFFGQVSL